MSSVIHMYTTRFKHQNQYPFCPRDLYAGGCSGGV